MKRTFCLFSFLCLFLCVGYSQAPDGYYASTEGKAGEELMIELHNIIKDHVVLTYNDLWSAFFFTDKREDGMVWDMYSACNFIFFDDQDVGLGGAVECDVYNREHSFPRSWFGGAIAPMNSDLFHIYPTDKKVNAVREDFPYGNVGSIIYTSSNGSKLGNSSISGYSGTVFEPIDEYKGDFARSYFYMATRYNNLIHTWSSDMLNGTQYPAFTSWAKNVLLQWHFQDPVSQKEIDRNNFIFENFQQNRNPFIDNPDFATLIWIGEVVPVTFTSTPITNTYVYSDYLYSIVAIGDEEASISISCTQKPEWLSFQQTGNGEAQLNGIPQINDMGDHHVTISATDGITTAFQNFVISVLEPTISFLSTPEEYIKTGNLYEYFIEVKIEENPTAQVTINCNEKPEWLTFSAEVFNEALLIGTPDIDDVGYHAVEIMATFGEFVSTQSFNIYVYEQGVLLDFFETFENIPENSSYYQTHTWTGNHGFQWLAHQARTDQTIEGRAICLENQGEPYIESQLLSGGCSRISFLYQQKFGENHGAISLFINDEQIGDQVISSEELQTADFLNIDLAGSFVIKLISDGGSAVAIDNLSWQSFFSLVPPEITIVSHSPQNPLNGEEVQVSAEVYSDNEIESVDILWGITSEALTEEVPMLLVNEYYIGTIILPNEGASVWYCVKAMDRAGLVAYSDTFEISIYQNQPPVISGIEFHPINPNQDQSVTVRAQVYDPENDPFDVYLVWGVDNGVMTDTLFMENLSGYYSGNIPVNPAGTTVSFMVVAEDDKGATGYSTVYTYTVSNSNHDNIIPSPCIAICPNPANEKVIITSIFPDPINIDIYGILGQRVVSIKELNHSGLIEVDLLGLYSGVYVIKVSFNDFSKSFRLIVNR